MKLQRLLCLFWPVKFNPTPTAVTIAGRALHWIALLVALALLALALSSFARSGANSGNDYWDSRVFDRDVGTMLVAIAIAVYGLGRFGRDRLSGE